MAGQGQPSARFCRKFQTFGPLRLLRASRRPLKSRCCHLPSLQLPGGYQVEHFELQVHDQRAALALSFTSSQDAPATLAGLLDVLVPPGVVLEHLQARLRWFGVLHGSMHFPQSSALLCGGVECPQVASEQSSAMAPRSADQARIGGVHSAAWLGPLPPHVPRAILATTCPCPPPTRLPVLSTLTAKRQLTRGPIFICPPALQANFLWCWNQEALLGCSRLSTLRSLALDSFHTMDMDTSRGLRVLLNQARGLTHLMARSCIAAEDGGWAALSACLQGHTQL